MLTPEDLNEIERKARAYQAEEAANPEAKTCHRPTPELVLRLVEEVRENKRHWDNAIRLAMKRGRVIEVLEVELDDLRAKATAMEADRNSWRGKWDCAIKEKVDAEAKVAELEKAKGGICMDCSKSSDEINALSSEVSRLEAEIIRKDDQWEARVRRAGYERRRTMSKEKQTPCEAAWKEWIKKPGIHSDKEDFSAGFRAGEEGKAEAILLKLLALKLARFERTMDGHLIEFCFDGIRYSCSRMDWNELIGVIGWDQARAAIAKHTTK